MARVKNTTASTITLDVEGKRHRIGPGKSVNVTPREALILGEYDGLEVDDRRKAIEAQDIPAPQEETRRTGGRQHVIDDPRKNMPGVPVTVTGDTGSTTPEPGTQGVSAAEHAAGDPNEVRTPEGGAGDAQGGPESETILKGAALDAALEEAGLSKSGTADEKRARLAEHEAKAAEEPSGDEDPLAWVDELDDANLDAALTAAELSTDGDVDAKRARLREHHAQPAADPAN